MSLCGSSSKRLIKEELLKVGGALTVCISKNSAKTAEHRAFGIDRQQKKCKGVEFGKGRIGANEIDKIARMNELKEGARGVCD